MTNIEKLHQPMNDDKYLFTWKEEEKVTEDEYEPPQKTVRKPNKPPARKIMKVQNNR